MNDVIQIFNEDSAAEDSTSAEFTMESVRSMVKQMNEIDDQIKDLRESKKEMVQDFIDEYNIPKKEVSVAIRMLKTDVDPETTVDILVSTEDVGEIEQAVSEVVTFFNVVTTVIAVFELCGQGIRAEHDCAGRKQRREEDTHL